MIQLKKPRLRANFSCIKKNEAVVKKSGGFLSIILITGRYRYWTEWLIPFHVIIQLWVFIQVSVHWLQCFRLQKAWENWFCVEEKSKKKKIFLSVEIFCFIQVMPWFLSIIYCSSAEMAYLHPLSSCNYLWILLHRWGSRIAHRGAASPQVSIVDSAGMSGSFSRFWILWFCSRGSICRQLCLHFRIWRPSRSYFAAHLCCSTFPRSKKLSFLWFNFGAERWKANMFVPPRALQFVSK